MSCTQVFDYDLVGPDVLIGAFDIALSSLEVTHESNAVWHPLYDVQNKLAGKLLMGVHLVGEKVIENLRVNTVLVGRCVVPCVYSHGGTYKKQRLNPTPRPQTTNSFTQHPTHYCTETFPLLSTCAYDSASKGARRSMPLPHELPAKKVRALSFVLRCFTIQRPLNARKRGHSRRMEQWWRPSLEKRAHVSYQSAVMKKMYINQDRSSLILVTRGSSPQIQVMRKERGPPAGTDARVFGYGGTSLEWLEYTACAGL